MDRYPIAVVLGAAAIALLLLLVLPVRTFFRGLSSGVRIDFLQLVFMQLRKVSPKVIMNALIMATQGGLQITRNEVEAHYMAGGDVMAVIAAMITAEENGVALSFEKASKAQLAGEDLEPLTKRQ